MANMRIGSYTFDLDPSHASWGYRLRTKSTDTYGGRVIQILGSQVEQMSIRGYVRPLKGPVEGAFENRFLAMERFEQDVKAIMDAQAQSKMPSELVYPPLGWGVDERILVYVTGFSNVKYDDSVSAFSYDLKMDVDSGFDEVVESALTYGLEDIPDGVRWYRNQYNTPVTNWEQVKNALRQAIQANMSGDYDASVYDYLEDYMDDVEASENIGDVLVSDGYEQEAADSQGTVENPEANQTAWTSVYGSANTTMSVDRVRK